MPVLFRVQADISDPGLSMQMDNCILYIMVTSFQSVTPHLPSSSRMRITGKGWERRELGGIGGGRFKQCVKPVPAQRLGGL